MTYHDNQKFKLKTKKHKTKKHKTKQKYTKVV